MLTAIKEIGEFFRKKNSTSDLDTLVQNPKCTHLITINFDKNFKLSNVTLEQCDNSKVKRYLYRNGNSPRGSDVTPASKLVEVRKTLNRINYWFNSYDKSNLQNDEKRLLDNIKNELINNKNEIEKLIEQQKNNLSRKDKVLLTIKIDDKYIGDYEVFKRFLLPKKTKEQNIQSYKGTCSVCGIDGKKVSGNINVFKFFTQDKPGFITGGFNEEQSSRNFPVCYECKLSLEQGKKLLRDNRFQVCKGIYCYIIPKFMLGMDFVREEITNILLYMPKRLSLKDTIKNRIFADENDILETLSNEKDILTLNFLFLKGTLYGPQDSEKIILLIEDVFPSRLRKIFEAKDNVDRIFVNESFTLGNIRYFFEKSDKNKQEYDLDRYFLEIVNSVFKDKKIDLNFLITFFMKKIRDELINTEYPYNAIRNAFKNIVFFETLDLISFTKEVVKMSMFDSLFQKFGYAFESPAKRGLFLLGALTEMLLRKQYNDKNSKPFWKQLKGLKMNERDIKGLLPKVQNKFQEYDAFDEGKRKIASEIANYLLTAEDNWKLSVDEINFYFSCGMNKIDEIKQIIYPEKNRKRC